MTRRNTPSTLGYLGVHGISSALVLVPFAIAALLEGGTGIWSGLFAFTVAVFMLGPLAAFVLGAPAALIGCLASEVLLRRVPYQWIHVLAFGIGGAGVGLLYSRTLLWGQLDLLWLSLGLATAIARASVIRWLPRVPVDDDSRPAVPAC